MSEERFTARAAVYGLLIKEGKVLLLRRFNTGWKDGSYSLPAGHLEAGERVTDAVQREVREEVGIDFDPAQATFVHAMFRKADKDYFDFFFVIESWRGEPRNVEPEKCDDLSWFPLDRLPENIVGSVRSAIGAYRNGVLFSEFGWNANDIE